MDSRCHRSLDVSPELGRFHFPNTSDRRFQFLAPRSKVAKATNTETVEEVVSSIQAITRAWQSGVTQTMQLAQTVAQARRQLRRGEWSKLWNSDRMPSVTDRE